MKTIATVKKLTGALLAGVALMLFANAASAATASGTSISNSATVSYTVNSVSQTPITSTAAEFKVDKELVLSIVRNDSSEVPVQPGQTTAAILTFTVTNNGNSTEDVSLAGVAEANGTVDPFNGAKSDSFDGTTMNVYADSNNNGVYDAGTDTKAYSSSLAAGASVKVFLVITGSPAFAANLTDGQVAVYAMKATVDQAGSCATSCTAETQDTTTQKDLNQANLDTVLNVFADTTAGTDDSARDGVISTRDAFIVQSAQLSITKSTTIVSDPVNGTTKPRAIPGAVIQYTITVSNASGASQSATGITISDDVAGQIGGTTTWVTGKLQVTSPAGTINPCEDDGAGKTTTSGVSCDYNFTSAGKVTVSGITLAANQNATVVYRVTIK